MNPVRNSKLNMINKNTSQNNSSIISNGVKKIFAFSFFVTSFVSLAIFISAVGAASVAHADPAGTMDGASCDFSGQGAGSGRMLGGACIAASAYVSQSNPQSGAAPTGSSSGFTALAPIPGLTDTSATSVIQSAGLASFFNNLYKYLIGLAATLAVIEIIWAGLDISFFHKDAVGAIVEDKGRIYNAIFGLILVLSPVLVFSIINPSILSLSLNLPKIDLTVTPITPATTVLPPCLAGNTKNCTPQAPLNETGTTSTLPTCGPQVVGSCVTAPAPACLSGQYCYTTTDTNNVGGIICSASMSDCTYLYTQQAKGGNGGVTVTGSGCTLCP